MYLCIDIATYLHTVYLDWQHAVIASNSRWAAPEDDDRVNVHLCGPCMSIHPPSLNNYVPGGRDQAS